MKHEMQIFPSKLMVGKKTQMSFAENTTFQLWNSFMAERKKILHTIGEDLYSIQNYPEGFYEKFDPSKKFEKWACREVSEFSDIPEGMDRLIIPQGKYAKFIYKGTNENAPEFFKQIFTQWLPASNYQLDLRPHFEIIGALYKKDDPQSEEEVWIPIKDKLV